jgi:hypothetical protein
MIISSVIALGLSLVGAFLGGAPDGALGATRGGAVAAWIGALLWWRYLRAGMRESGKIPDGSGWWPRRQGGRRADPAQALTRGARPTPASQIRPPPPPGTARQPEPPRLGR